MDIVFREEEIITLFTKVLISPGPCWLLFLGDEPLVFLING